MKALGSPKVVLTWVGSEDRNSRVFPPGRPFVAEIKNPKKRVLGERMLIRSRWGFVGVSGLSTLQSRLAALPPFKVLVSAVVRPKEGSARPSSHEIKERRKGFLVQFHSSKGKLVYKRIYSIRFKESEGLFLARIEMDGGLPVKKFVSGDSVSPSVSELLKTKVECLRFDVLRVVELGDLTFG
jgi:tRNA pseudouridine synthase 10